jgi:membrane-associated protein
MKFQLLDLILNLDKHLIDLINTYHSQIYLLLFGTIFVETGLVFTPFIPGDSLLFASGLLARPENGSKLNVTYLLLLLPFAAVLGDLINFHIGKFFGQVLHKADDSGILKTKHLEKTRAFFELHGSKAIIMGRFVPVVRTVAPFVAGMDGMELRWFFPLSVIAAILWVFVCVGGGFLLGQFSFVQHHFTGVLLGVVSISCVAFVLETLRHRVKAKKSKLVPKPETD